MSKHNFYVYEHWRLDRDECFYVGKGKGNRAYNMKKRNRHHKAVVAKVMREGFAVDIRIVLCGLSEKEAFKLEVDRISFWRLSGADLTNMTNGGEGASGFKMPEDVRKKMSQSQLKRAPRSPHSIETRMKIGLASKGRKYHGVLPTATTIEKMRKNGLKSLNTFKMYSHLGPKSTSRKVLCVDDGSVFDSASSAARAHNVPKSAVIEICLGKKHRKTIGGKSFKYVEVE